MVYQVLLFMHLIGAILLMSGSALGSVLQVAARKTNDAKQLTLLAQLGSRVPMLTMPGSLMAAWTGLTIVYRQGYGFTTPWVAMSILFWIVAFVTAIVVFRPIGMKAQAAIAKLPPDAVEAPELKAVLADRSVFIAARITEVIALCMIALMVFKPGM